MASLSRVSGQGQIIPFLSSIQMRIEDRIDTFLSSTPAVSREVYRMEILHSLEQFDSFEEQLANVDAIAESVIGHEVVNDGGSPLIGAHHALPREAQVSENGNNHSEWIDVVEGIEELFKGSGHPYMVGSEADFKKFFNRLQAAHSDDLHGLKAFFKICQPIENIKNLSLTHIQQLIKGCTLPPHSLCRGLIEEYIPNMDLREIIEGYAYPDLLNFVVNHQKDALKYLMWIPHNLPVQLVMPIVNFAHSITDGNLQSHAMFLTRLFNIVKRYADANEASSQLNLAKEIQELHGTLRFKKIVWETTFSDLEEKVENHRSKIIAEIQTHLSHHQELVSLDGLRIGDWLTQKDIESLIDTRKKELADKILRKEERIEQLLVYIMELKKERSVEAHKSIESKLATLKAKKKRLEGEEKVITKEFGKLLKKLNKFDEMYQFNDERRGRQAQLNELKILTEKMEDFELTLRNIFALFK